MMESKQLITAKVFLYIQYFLAGVSSIGMLLLLFFTFDFPNIYTIIGIGFLLFYLGRTVFKKDTSYKKILTISIVMMIFANFGLNSYFYPNLLKYQAGIRSFFLSFRLIEEEEIPKETVYIYNEDYSWTLDFYSERNTPSITLEQIKDLETDIWLYTYEQQTLEDLKAHNIVVKNQYTVDHFRVTKLNMRFLNPKSRASKLRKVYLLHIAL